MFVGLIALLAVALVTTACSSSKKTSANAGNGGSTTTGTTPATTGGGATTSAGGGAASAGTLVHVKNFAFAPATVNVSVGTKVTWQFDDSVSHNVTASDNSFTSNDLNGGATFSFTFNKAGTYNYICSIHPRMKASVVVK
jgi:plastocyanin